MSVERIKDLLALMDEHELVELDLEEGDFKVRLKKQAGQLAGIPAPLHMPPPLAAPQAAAADAKPAAQDEGLVPVKSPIVGTFYRAPSPDADPFVREGDRVSEQTVVCIIEAMKIMNEIKAETSGTVERVLVENGEPVEYGQVMFLVRP